jgi:hypothetical protein
MPVLHVDLPSGQAVELREKLKAHDRFAVQSVIMLGVSADGTPQGSQSGSMVNNMRNVLLTNLIQSWTVTGDDDAVMPIPKEAPVINADTGERRDVLGEMGIDDYNHLADVVEPMFNKVLNIPNRTAPSAS